MLAYVGELKDEEWCILVHGETRGKAKSRFASCNPEAPLDRYDFTFIRLQRFPALDNKPFTRSTLDEADFHFSNENEDDPATRIFVNDCDCPLCNRRGK